MLNQIRHLSGTSRQGRHPQVAPVYRQIRRDFGMVADPFALHALSPPLLAAMWAMCRESELVGDVPRALKELVATSVSAANHCPYCVEAHTMLLGATGARGLADGPTPASAEASALAAWARASRNPDAPEVASPPFDHRHSAELIGVALFFHYLNRMVHLFLPEGMLPVKSDTLRRLMQRLGGVMMGRWVRRAKRPGDALALIPKVPLPDDLQWAASSPHVAAAFAAMAAVTEELAEREIPAEVRERLHAFLAHWRGEDPGLSVAHLTRHEEGLPDAQRPMLRLALLTVAAPYRVDDALIREFRHHHPHDETLLATAAWGAFQASRRIGCWLRAPSPLLPNR